MANPEYDAKDPLSIVEYAKRLVGLRFLDVINDALERELAELSEKGVAFNGSVSDAEIMAQFDKYSNPNRKGGLGNLLEELYFGYKANSDSHADFSEAGVELKVSPYEKKANGELKAGERLVLSMIANDKPFEMNFFLSHVWDKCKLMLLIYYFRDKSLENNKQYEIDYVSLFTPPKEDLEIMVKDYNIIRDKFMAGKAHEISEGDTMYLGACTKGATAATMWAPQFYAPTVPAKRRAFCFKQPYMTYVLNEYLAKGLEQYVIEKKGEKENIEQQLKSPLQPYGKGLLQDDESVVANPEDLKNVSFEDYLIQKVQPYVGKTDVELMKEFDVEFNAKSTWTQLAYRMLGIKNGRAKEFVKANIAVKAIRVEATGKLRESSPLPTFKFKDIVNENWEDSELYTYLEEQKFLYFVFQKTGENEEPSIFKGVCLWNMPYTDLTGEVQAGWQQVKDTLIKGVAFKLEKYGDGQRVRNNLLEKTANGIIHLRPHASKSFYRFADGTTFGSGTEKDADELPDGRLMVKQSFWLNSDYILNELKKHIKL